MLTLSAFARKRRLSRSRIHQLLQAGRIEGAKLIGTQRGARRVLRERTPGIWLIPPDAKILPPRGA